MVSVQEKAGYWVELNPVIAAALYECSLLGGMDITTTLANAIGLYRTVERLRPEVDKVTLRVTKNGKHTNIVL